MFWLAVVVCFCCCFCCHVFPAILAVFDKFEVFVDDLVALVGHRELLLNECEKGFPSFDVFTEGS